MMMSPTRDHTHSSPEEKDREGVLLCLKIKDQLEDLFSDSHLAQDGFLLKHVQRNREGYVSLKLLTCLKKIKVLTTDWYMTLAAAEYSLLLEVNDDCTKVRRKEPVPKWLLCSPTSKLLLIWNISERSGGDGAPQGTTSSSLSERILQKISVHCSVTSIWIVEPDKELPKELQSYAKRHKELGQHLCAVLKFEHLKDVRRAYNVLKEEEEKSNGEHMCVVPLGYQSMHSPCREENILDQTKDENQLENLQELVLQDVTLPFIVSAETPETPLNNESLKSPQTTFDFSRMNLCFGDGCRENVQVPWVLKRKFAFALNTKDLNGPCLRQRVLRQPYGPDGTKGFLCRRELLQRGKSSLTFRRNDYFDEKW